MDSQEKIWEQNLHAKVEKEIHCPGLPGSGKKSNFLDKIKHFSRRSDKSPAETPFDQKGHREDKVIIIIIL